ncbi:MAG: hypothetical protein ACK5CW_01950 [Verrucomicrobiota bacterium]|jgi:hypothetical protein
MTAFLSRFLPVIVCGVLFHSVLSVPAGVYGVAGPRGGAVVATRPAVVARPVVVAPRPVVVAPRPVVVAPRPVVVAPVLPSGYVHVVPAGYRTMMYRGYNCRFVGGVYYRPVMYQGTSVWVVVH